MVGDLLGGIRGDPIPLERKLEERGDDAAAIVVGLEAGVAALKVGGQGGRRKLGDGHTGEVLFEHREMPADRDEVGRGDEVLRVLVGFRRQVFVSSVSHLAEP
jgi:hypothetical protein